MVSEDSEQFRSGLPCIHLLRDLNQSHQSFTGLVKTSLDQLDTSRELLEVLLLRGVHRMLPEERNHDFQQILPLSHSVSIEMLSVVVMPGVDEDLTGPEELTQFVQTPDALGTLRHGELVAHLESGSISSASRSIGLFDEPDTEASLTVDEPGYPAQPDQPFLLVTCTHRIVTIEEPYGPPGSVGFPRLPSIWPDAHRTVTSAGGSESTLGLL